MEIENHWLSGVRHLPSPNNGERPPDQQPELLVIHNISLPPGRFGGGHVDELFLNRLDPEGHPFFSQIATLRVSSHLLIDRSGRITQYVPFDRAAWHAGESCYRGRQRCNEFSIGIELEGCDDRPFEDVQYQCLARVTDVLLTAYPTLSADRITGHSDIAPGRKTDPGPCFEWRRYRRLLEPAPADRNRM